MYLQVTPRSATLPCVTTCMRRPIHASKGEAQNKVIRRVAPLGAACGLVQAPKPPATVRWSRSARRTDQATSPRASGSVRTGALTPSRCLPRPLCPREVGRALCAGDISGGGESKQGVLTDLAGYGGNLQHVALFRVLHVVNNSTKWTVTAAAAATLVFSPTAEVLWCITGSVAAAVLCKVRPRATAALFAVTVAAAGSRLCSAGAQDCSQSKPPSWRPINRPGHAILAREQSRLLWHISRAIPGHTHAASMDIRVARSRHLDRHDYAGATTACRRPPARF